MITGIQASSSTLPQTELIGELTGKKVKFPYMLPISKESIFS